MQKYFRLLTGEFCNIDPPEVLIEKLMKSTTDMIKNDGKRTNKDVFTDSFMKMVEIDDEEGLMGRFDNFYRDKFPDLKNHFELDNKAEQLINLLKKADYDLVIATNPLFPRAAITERIRWAGLDPADFCYITSYENMHFCKPDPGFFRELLDKLNLKASECIMIGNDMEEDIIAGKLGFTTFLVDDFKIDRNTNSINPDWQGSFRELIDYFKKT